MQNGLDFDYIFKYILVGDASVGKSALLHMFINQRFNDETNPTMGVEFATKKQKVRGSVIKLQIWDTAGQESFRTITRAYYKNAIGVILMYDVANPKSFESIKSWLAEVGDNSNEKAQLVIVGNKSDLIDKVRNQYQGDLPHLLTSAKTGENVEKVFSSLTQRVLGKVQNGTIDADGSCGVKRGKSAERSNQLSFIKHSEEENRKVCC